MARIQLGGIISDIRGSVGGTTFSKYRQGFVMKSKAKQPKANTFYRNRFLNYSRHVAALYRNLSPADIVNWDNYAAFRNATGGSEFPTLRTGSDWFRALNFYRVANNITPLTTPVLDVYDIENTSIGSINGTYPNEVELNRALVSTDEFFVLKMSLPLIDSWQNVASRMRVVLIDAIDADTFDVGGDYTARFGYELSPGMKVCASVSVFSLNSGFYYPFFPQLITLD